MNTPIAKTDDDAPDRKTRSSQDDDRDTPDGSTVVTTQPDPIGKDPEDPPH